MWGGKPFRFSFSLQTISIWALSHALEAASALQAPIHTPSSKLRSTHRAPPSPSRQTLKILSLTQLILSTHGEFPFSISQSNPHSSFLSLIPIISQSDPPSHHFISQSDPLSQFISQSDPHTKNTENEKANPLLNP